MSEHRGRQLLTAVTVCIVLVVLGDLTRRSLSAPAPTQATPGAVAAPPSPPPTPREDPPGGAATQPGATPPTPAGPSYMEQVARAETRRQIRQSVGRTYLNEIVAASWDSMLRRWDGRASRPVRVFLPASSAVPHFQPAFVAAVQGAFRTWEALGLPVRFDLAADSASADVHVQWREQFDQERTGQTDLEWDGNGHVQRGLVTLATRDPNGRALGPKDVGVVALHEVGHVLGLDHSPEPSDLMHPVATVQQLSARDVETARLLYRLTPGSVR